MGLFNTIHEGNLALDAVPADFADRMARRVVQGLLVRGIRQRANYAVRQQDRSTVAFGAEDALTAFNVGLNEVVLRRIDDRQVSYRIDYGRWRRYAYLLSIVIMLPFAVALCFPQVQQAFAAQPTLPYLLWGMVVFWGLVWPWLLALMHRRVAALCLERIVREVCTGEDASGVLSGQGRRYTSQARILGMPLVSIATGPDAATGQQRGVARGFLAIGDVAIGVVAVGGVALGGFAVGGLSVGLLALGGAAAGLCAIGGGAVGVVAIGGGAVGVVAVGGGALGINVIGPATLGGA